MKYFLSRAVGIFLLLSFAVNTFGCTLDNEYSNYSKINGKNLYFATDTEKLSWKEPLTKLMQKAFLAKEAGENSPDHDLLPKEDETAIAMSYGCGLLDVTADGMPELLVHPFGYYGSSGTTTYFVYDIVGGDYLGKIDGGNNESFCFYYDIESEQTILIGQYWLRGGWDHRDHFLTKISFDPQNKNCKDEIYLQSSHEIVVERKDLSEDGTETYVETYVCSNYYIHGQPTELEHYDAEQRAFENSHIRIPETELLIIRWGEVADGEDNSLKIEQMTEALIHSDQKFLKP